MSQRRAPANPAKRGRLLAESEPPQTMKQHRYGPWIMKQVLNKWVIDQADLTAGLICRFGIYDTEAEAREMLKVLRGSK